MRRVVMPVLVVVGVLALFCGTLGFLVVKGRPATEELEWVDVGRGDVVLKTVATGAIVPRVEIEIKSRVSGVLSALHVEPGAQVESGSLIAEVQIIPDSATLNNAQQSLRTARIERDNAATELERAESLSARAALSTAELQRARRDHDLARQSYDAALSNLQIVREGATSGTGNVLTEVRSTVDGMVLAVDVEEGESVTETNTFNAGTTIASVADMTDMVFEGSIDESEVGRIREGMPLDITVGALRDHKLAGTLEYISPKGVLVDGAVEFEIRAAITAQPELFIRAGSSANADIVLDRREGVVTVDERALRFEEDAIYVERQAGSATERVDIEVGLSDGLSIEILQGLSEGDRVLSSATDGSRRRGRRR